MEEKGWKKISGQVSSKFRWICTPARKKSKKGRAKGGIIVDVNKKLQRVNIKAKSTGSGNKSIVEGTREQ